MSILFITFFQGLFNNKAAPPSLNCFPNVTFDFNIVSFGSTVSLCLCCSQICCVFPPFSFADRHHRFTKERSCTLSLHPSSCRRPLYTSLVGREPTTRLPVSLSLPLLRWAGRTFTTRPTHTKSFKLSPVFHVRSWCAIGARALERFPS